MADQWFYRMFGEDFGPMPLEKLQELASSGTVQALDLVRAESSGEWVAAATIDELGLSTSERRTAVAVAVKPASDPEMSATQTASDDWYCQLGGQELGPLSFDELLKYAEHEQLGADDQVKLGPKGKWRRVGSIGRLMAALPYQAVEKSIVVGRSTARIDRTTDTQVISKATTTMTPVVAAPDPAATYRVAYEQAKAKLTESMLAQADAVFKAAEEQAQSQIAWATAPNVDRYWWGWANGVEFGPVEFTQVFGLAKSGQLKPSDFVRNGTHGQFIPSSNVPGLYRALEIIARATETRNLARSQAQAAAALALPPVTAPTQLINAAEQQATSNASIATPAAAPKSNPTIDTTRPAARPASDPQVATRKSDPQITMPAAAAEPAPAAPVETPRPAPSLAYSSSNYGASSSMSGFSSSSSSMSTYGTSRQVTPPKSYPKRSSRPSSPWLSDMLESLKEPKALGAIGTIALVLLIVGWSYLPKNRSADLKQYHALKTLVDEIKAKRTTAPAELPKIEQLLAKLGKEIAVSLKEKASRDDPAKQCLLWAARDEVPRFIQAGLAMESPAEKSLEARLREAAYELGLEKRPPVDLAQLAARANDD